MKIDSRASLIPRCESSHPLTLELRISQASSTMEKVTVVASNNSSNDVLLSSLGFELYTNPMNLLIDGYHSWDNVASGVGAQGWWSAIWEEPNLSPHTCSLAGIPRYALHISSSRNGLLFFNVGPPEQNKDCTGDRTSLEIVLKPHQTFVSDSLLLGASSPLSSYKGPISTGWMSWNCWGAEITAAKVLAAAEFVTQDGIVLLDDGWMPHWGDWHVRPEFGSSLHEVAATLQGDRKKLGVWLAPFAVDVESSIAKNHPDWLLRDEDNPLIDIRPNRAQYVLDGSLPEVQRHFGVLAETLAKEGVQALKLDFLYQGALSSAHSSGSITALRQGLHAFVSRFWEVAGHCPVFACGAPAPVIVGLATSCRSGGDSVINVPTLGAPLPPTPHFFYEDAMIQHQLNNGRARTLLWGNEPVCDYDAVSLTSIPECSLKEISNEQWAEEVAASGGPLFFSDREMSPEQKRFCLELQEKVQRENRTL